MKICSDCLQILDASTISNATTRTLINRIQGAAIVLADTKPYPETTGASVLQRRSDQYFDGSTHITDSVTGDDVGQVFGSKSVVMVAGKPQDKWTETWVITDPDAHKKATSGSKVEWAFSYEGSDTDADSFVIGMRASKTPPPKMLRMSVDFFYEDFPSMAVPSDAFPSSVPAGLDVVIFDVYTRDDTGAEELSGMLFRMVDSAPSGTAELLHMDHWFLYSNYGAPTDTSKTTILRENSTHSYDSVEEMAEDVPTAPDVPYAKWYVRTQALYRWV